MNSKISYAVAAILGGGSLAASAADPATDSSSAATDTIAEITVTAQRRSENMQDVPISMQALTAQSLQQLNVATFDDYIKFLPNVTTASNGPGQSEVYMRGLSAGSQPSQGSGSTGLWPNVAIYLDNQSGQLPNRNLDIYAADLNRIEVLEGPQGTLFGAGGAEPAADHRHHGRARSDLQRQARRLHRQCAGDVCALRHRSRHPLCKLSGRRRTLPGRRSELWLLRAAWQPNHQ
jgi:outer membrane receptor protein involved in Fe transport